MQEKLTVIEAVINGEKQMAVNARAIRPYEEIRDAYRRYVVFK
jgi:hypothetical protein